MEKDELKIYYIIHLKVGLELIAVVDASQTWWIIIF